MWHIEFNLITACLARLGEAVMFMEAGSRLATESRPGRMTLCTNPELGMAILQSVWRTGDFLLMSKDALEPGREEAVRRAAGAISAERYRLPDVDLERAPGRPVAPAGPGKSAIVLALQRFIDAGELTVDGAGARAFFPERLRTLLAGSPEQPFRALLWVAHCPAELAASRDLVDPAVRRHAGARPAG
jgi:hypothetical protein